MTEPTRQREPFVILPRYVIDEAPKAIDVYAKLRTFADFETGECYPSIQRIADELSISRRTVERRIKQLAAIGALKIVSGKHAGETNLYRFPEGRYDTSDVGGASAVSHRVRQESATNEEPLNVEPENDIRRASRRRDLLWECFVEVHGEPATDSERGKYNRIVKTLREADPPVTPDEYPALVAAYVTKYRGSQPAAPTVAQRIGELRHFVKRGGVDVGDLDEINRLRRLAEYDDTDPEQMSIERAR